MMQSELKAGDIIAVSGKSFQSKVIQAGTMRLPNIGPLGRWGLAGISHVGIVCPVFGEPLVYESTTMGRAPCVRTGRDSPQGVQAHFVADLVDSDDDVWHYPLHRELYAHEELRLLNYLESCLGHGYDYIRAGKSAGSIFSYLVSSAVGKPTDDLMFCSELVMGALCQVGLTTTRNNEAWNPARLMRQTTKRGITKKPILLS